MKRLSFTIMATVLLLTWLSACSPPAKADSGMQFLDVHQGDVAAKAIEYVSAEGYMVGKSNHVFDPDSPVTRAEITVLILRAKHGAEFSPDRAEGEWWVPWVNEAEAEGLVEKVTNPNVPATRADIATLIWLLTQ
jgi:hypothetical protein